MIAEDIGVEAFEEPRGNAHWLHFILLLALVSTFEGGRMLVASEAPFLLSVFLHSLYVWMPTIAGIAISITPASRLATGRGIVVGLAAMALMVVLDLWSSALPQGMPETSALLPGGSLSAMTAASETAAVSWVRTLLSFLQGNLPAAAELTTDYAVDHPRFRVAEAFARAGMVLVVFGTIGVVIGVASWMRVHVVFRKRDSRRTSQIVVAWLVAPLVTQISNELSFDQRFSLLFRGGALWKPLVPPVIFLLLGLAAWWYTARYRESDAA